MPSVTTKTICFDVSKLQQYTPSNGYKLMQKKLKSLDYRISMHQEDYSQAALKEVSLLIISNPQKKFTGKEFDNLKSFISEGGNILFMGHEKGEPDVVTSNFNYFLEEYGMSTHDDCVCRASFMKYYHPKQVLVTDGIMNREINRVAGKQPVVGSHQQEIEIPAQNSFMKSHAVSPVSLSFLYPNGCTLSIQKPAITLLSTGSTSIPHNRPVCGFLSRRDKAGKLIALGSQFMFHDDYMEKEENSKLFDVLLKLLLTDDIQLNSMDANDPEISEYHYVPDTSVLAKNPRPCFEESEELPMDFNSMFIPTLFKMDAELVPEVNDLYKTLNIPNKHLKLVEPKFQVAIPSLKVATYPPILSEPQAPLLELFDLDEDFATEKTRLAQLTNKCTNVDLEFYIRECGRTLGIVDALPAHQQTAKFILQEASKRLIQWKMLNPS